MNSNKQIPGLTKEDINILNNIFTGQSYNVIVFGSRAAGKHRKYSDLDICLKSKNNKKLDLLLMSDLREKLENSDLLYTVDLIDYNNISKEFKEIIDTTGCYFS